MRSRSADDSCRFANAATYSTSFWVIFIVLNRIEYVQYLCRSTAESSPCNGERSLRAAFASSGLEPEPTKFHFDRRRPAFGLLRLIHMPAARRAQPLLLQV